MYWTCWPYTFYGYSKQSVHKVQLRNKNKYDGTFETDKSLAFEFTHREITF